MDWTYLPTAIALGLMIGGMALIVWAAAHRGAQKERACAAEQQTEFTASMDRFGYVQDARNRGHL